MGFQLSVDLPEPLSAEGGLYGEKRVGTLITMKPPAGRLMRSSTM